MQRKSILVLSWCHSPPYHFLPAVRTQMVTFHKMESFTRVNSSHFDVTCRERWWDMDEIVSTIMSLKYLCNEIVSSMMSLKYLCNNIVCSLMSLEYLCNKIVCAMSVKCRCNKDCLCNEIACAILGSSDIQNCLSSVLVYYDDYQSLL